MSAILKFRDGRSRKPSCSGSVYDGRMGPFSCSKPGKFEVNGKLWCGFHDPRKIEARNKASEVEYKIKQERDTQIYNMAKSIGKKLGVEVQAYYGRDGYTDAIIMSFKDADKLVARLENSGLALLKREVRK